MRLRTWLMICFLVGSIACNGKAMRQEGQDVLLGYWELYKWSKNDSDPELIKEPVLVEYRQDQEMRNHSGLQRCQYRYDVTANKLFTDCRTQEPSDIESRKSGGCDIEFLSSDEFTLKCPATGESLYYYRRVD